MPFRAKPKYSGVVGKSFPIKNRPCEAAEIGGRTVEEIQRRIRGFAGEDE